jgi:hypothetical protein
VAVLNSESEKKLRNTVDEFFEHLGEKVDAKNGKFGEALYYHTYASACKPDVARDLLAEIDKLRAFIKGVKEFDPRSDIYASDLQDECNDVLGLCRCCGQEVCDDA